MILGRRMWKAVSRARTSSRLGAVTALLFSAGIVITPTSALASGLAHDNGPTSGSPIASGAPSQSDATFSGTLPAWAGQGSTLDVYQWPNLSGAVIGQPIQLPMVTSVPVTGSQFNLSLPGGSDNNYQFVLQNGTYTGTSTVTTGGGASQGSVGFGGPESHLAINSPASIIRVPPFYVTTGRVSNTARSANLTVSLPDCTATLISNIGTEPIIVGEAHTLSTTSGTFSFGGTSTSTVGIGISGSGAYGSFSSEGNYSQTTGWTTGLVVPSGTHEKVAANFTDGKFNLYCGALNYYMGIVEIPYQFTGTLIGDGSAGTNPSGTCPSPSGITLSTSNPQTAYFGSSVSYGSQVSLLGFGFSENTSWTSTSQMAWVSNPGTGPTGLCGPGQTYPVGQPVIYNSAL